MVQDPDRRRRRRLSLQRPRSSPPPSSFVLALCADGPRPRSSPPPSSFVTETQIVAAAVVFRSSSLRRWSKTHIAAAAVVFRSPSPSHLCNSANSGEAVRVASISEQLR
ncbi:hypothetical protein ACFX2G_034933 [Malus domestica]